MKIIWKSTSEQIDQVRVREPREMSLSLKPSNQVWLRARASISLPQ